MEKTLEEKIQEIDIQIPEQFLVSEKQDKIDLDLLEGRTLVGLLGYAKCGKDTVAEILSTNYGYSKIKFGDKLKQVLNENFKEIVLQDLKKKGESLSFSEIDFLVEEDRIIKEKLRPYMIWFAENLRKLNGVHYWTNMALRDLDESVKKIVVADTRRLDELDIFRDNYNSLKREWASFSKAGLLTKERVEDFNIREEKTQKYSTHLFFINQFSLDDEDNLTKNTILTAFREWLIDGEMKIDPRIPDEGDYRETFIKNTVSAFASEYKL